MMSAPTHPFARAPRRSLIVLLAAGTLALAGCAASGDSGETDAPAVIADPYAPEVSEVTVAGYINAGMTPVYAAQSEGFGDDYGLSVTVQPAETSAAMLAQIVGGDVPMATINGFFSVPAIQGGADLRVIGEAIRGIEGAQTVEVLPDSGIEDLADLEGKKVAVVGLMSGHQARIEYAMNKEGLDPSKVEFVSLGFNEMAAALEQGTVDAVTVTGPGQLQVQSVLGSRTILDLAAGDFVEFPDAQWLVNGEWADAHPNAVAAFQCLAVVKGQQLVNDDQQLYEDTLTGFGYSPEAVAADVKLIFPEANQPAQIIPDIMYGLGWITEEFDMASVTIPLPENC